MIARALRKRFDIFFVIFFICPNESQKLPVNYPAMKSARFGVVQNVLRDVNKPQFTSFRSAGRLFRGFDLNDMEIKKFRIWEKGLVPFYIDTLSFSDKVLRDKIRWFLNEVNSYTPLNFLELPSPPKDDKYRWVFFVNRQGRLDCSDISIKNFTNEGVQPIVLGYDCINKDPGLAQTVLAVAGIPPQHNAPNRDEFIKVIEKNIIPVKKYLFEKLRDNEWLFHDFKYDFESASHYHHHKHSANGRATIKVKIPHKGITMGDQRGFSKTDVEKIRMTYSYIVKKNKPPACSQLFKRGKKKHSKMSLYMKEEMKPYPKPLKYTGGKQQSDNESLSAETSKNVYSDDSVQNISETSASSDIDLNRIGLSVRNNTQNQSHTKLKTYQDPLSYLSDYQTGDESLQRSAWRKNRDYYNFGKVGAYFKST